MSKETIGIIGTGMIATSLSVLTTGHGYKTLVFSRSASSAQRCRENWKNYFDDMREYGLITKEQINVCSKYLSVVFDYNDLKECDVIFECIAEDLSKKQQVYSLIEENCPSVKAICSVSSSIEANELIKKADIYKDRIIVTHPFNPVHMVPYFEIAISDETSVQTAPYIKELLEKLDRKPVILKKSSPGFIGNRLQFALWREALYIAAEGIADIKDIETCMKYSFCPRYTSIGIFEHFDNGGLELNAAVSNSLFPTLSNATEIPQFMKDMIEKGYLGQKSSKGFHDWKDVDIKEYTKSVNAPYIEFCSWDYPLE